jgi:glycosyltransferase involved in cell wall biosynthesis
MQPRISILIATFNQPNYIEECVRSALNQDYPNIEVIVSDDSLNNETEVRLQKFTAHGNFKYFQNQNNVGRVANYRKLLYEYSSGDWVIILDGDDFYIDTNYLSKVAKVINENSDSIVMVGSGHKAYYEDTNVFVDYNASEHNILFTGIEMFLNKIPITQHTTNVYKKILACDIDFYRHPSNASDAESLYRLCLHGTVSYLSGLPLVWRIHKSNQTFKRDFTKQFNELNFIDSVSNYAIPFIGKKNANEWTKHQYQSFSFHLLDIAFQSRKIKNVWIVCLKFGRVWGLRGVIQALMKFLYSNKSNNSVFEKILLRCFEILRFCYTKIIK